jgi:DNA-binding transcriptional LysR family regulator
VQTYLRQYPDIELQLQHINPDDQLAAFDEGTLDLGLSRPLPPERRPYLEEEVLYKSFYETNDNLHNWPFDRHLDFRTFDCLPRSRSPTMMTKYNNYADYLTAVLPQNIHWPKKRKLNWKN